MAKIVTLELLVNSDDESEIADGLNDMLRAAQSPVDPDQDGITPWIVDWRLGYCGGQLRLQSLPAFVDASVAKGDYAEGDAFPSSSVPLHPGFEYELAVADPKAMDSLWIGVPSLCDKEEGGDLSVLVKRTHEGVIVDIWPASQEDGDESLASAAAMFSDAPRTEEEAAA